MVTKERDGVAQPTSQLAEVVSRAHVTEAVQKQKGVDLAEQLLFMDPITEVGEGSLLSPAQKAAPVLLLIVTTLQARAEPGCACWHHMLYAMVPCRGV